MEKVKDKYDLAIEYLLAQKDPQKAARDAWFYPRYKDQEHRAHCLFQTVSPSGRNIAGEIRCGCLTQIRAHLFEAWTEDLTERIRNDERLPKGSREITPETLPVFAEWQRELDATIRNGVQS